MENNQQDDLIEMILLHRNTESYNLFLRLFKSEIGRLRRDNDEAEGIAIHRNQGGIALLKKLISDLEVIKIGTSSPGAYGA